MVGRQHLLRVMGHIDVGSKIWSRSSPPSHRVDTTLAVKLEGKMKHESE